MIYYLLLPLIAVGLIVLQTVLADLLFSGWITLELSLIVVIYTGFRMDLVKGMMLAALMGFVLDCLSGAVIGLHTFIYLLVFTLSFFTSLRMVSEKNYLIALFSVFCCALESLIVSLVYRFVLNYEMPGITLLVFVPQTLLLGMLSVGFFYGMRKIEGLMYGKAMQPPQRPGTGGISAEA
jgi:rod shape-determining protein MreD